MTHFFAFTFRKVVLVCRKELEKSKYILLTLSELLIYYTTLSQYPAKTKYLRIA